MKIALDYDGTYTRDPEFWNLVIALGQQSRHDIRIVTMRGPETPVDVGWPPEVLPVIYTSLMQKREYCDEIDWHPDVWIDDSPEFIVRRDVAKFLDVFNPKQDA